MDESTLRTFLHFYARWSLRCKYNKEEWNGDTTGYEPNKYEEWEEDGNKTALWRWMHKVISDIGNTVDLDEDDICCIKALADVKCIDDISEYRRSETLELYLNLRYKYLEKEYDYDYHNDGYSLEETDDGLKIEFWGPYNGFDGHSENKGVTLVYDYTSHNTYQLREHIKAIEWEPYEHVKLCFRHSSSQQKPTKYKTQTYEEGEVVVRDCDLVEDVMSRIWAKNWIWEPNIVTKH